MTKSEGASSTKGQDESQSGAGSGSGSASEDGGASSDNPSVQQQQQQDDPKGSESATTAAGASGPTGNTGGSAAASSSTGVSPAVATATTMTVAPAVAALNVYKKVAIIRGSDDVLTYEDTNGTVKSITDLHLAAVATVSDFFFEKNNKRKKRAGCDDISMNNGTHLMSSSRPPSLSNSYLPEAYSCLLIVDYLSPSSYYDDHLNTTDAAVTKT